MTTSLEKGIMEKASFRLKIKIFWAFMLCANLYSVQFLSGNVLSGISDRKRLSWDLLQDACMVLKMTKFLRQTALSLCYKTM